MFPSVLLVATIFAANNIHVSLACFNPECDCCAPNQEYVNATLSCPPTCEMTHPPCLFSKHSSSAGCQCKRGYVFLSDKNKTCVPIDECPATCSKPHFEYDKCGTRCPITCQNKKPRNCDSVRKVYQSGCFCIKPYILDEITLTCVSKDDCPCPDID